MFIKFTVVTY
uniref:Uncharacterized protein n=1 Tax=Arundo donax TaxID=35708 RepID=A0A0A8Y7S8_ARUDO